MSWFRKQTKKSLPPKKREVALLKKEELKKVIDKEFQEDVKEYLQNVNTNRIKGASSE
jgi:hypothetical protein